MIQLLAARGNRHFLDDRNIEQAVIDSAIRTGTGLSTTMTKAATLCLHAALNVLQLLLPKFRPSLFIEIDIFSLSAAWRGP
jgi:hypothetical protein